MAELVVLAFDSEDGALEMRDKLLDYRKDRMLQLSDAAVVVRQQDGQVKVKQLTNLVGGGAFGGAFWGLLIGLLFAVPWLGLAVGAAAGVGAHAFIFGGDTPDGQTDGSLRAGVSPQSPYYQLGVAGITIPALSIKGEVGQQIGYINAMTVGMINFVILVIIGVAFSRPESSRRVLSRLSGGRLKMPDEEQYRS